MRVSLVFLKAVALSVLLVGSPAPSKEGEEDLFAKWESKIRDFEEADKRDPPEPGGVLFVGSSSIRVWDTAKAFPDLRPINRGFGGSTTAELNHFSDRIVTPYRARIIVIYAGDNDVSQGMSPESVAADFGTFVKLAQRETPV